MEVAPFFVDFHHFLSIFTIYALLSQFTFCRDLRTFYANFFLAKIAFSATSHVFCMYDVNTIWWFAAHKIPSSLRPLAEPIASGVLSYDQVASLPLHQKKANRSVDTANRAYSQNTPWNTQGNGRNKAKLQDTVNVQCILSKVKV